MAESKDVNTTFPHIPFNHSKSFHSTVEGKVWTRLLIHLCWWLHDMYETDGTDPNAKFEYIEEKISQCRTLFPGKFKLMFSDPDVSPNEQHPLLICRQDEQKIIIVVFRATVSSKSLQDVFTDMSIHSNHHVYIGSRHSGFSKRAESGPLLAVTNRLRRRWKVIITGHSLGGAVSQLFTAHVINNLVEAGLLPEMVSLRCVTFGTPQCADYHFWSSYTKWYDVFDTYIYEHDAIFRLATFGTEFIKKVTDSFAGYLLKAGVKMCTNVIGYRNQDQTDVLRNATDQICEFTSDALVPAYSIFGRHHFIRKGEKSEFKIDSLGEQEKEKERLLKDLSAGHRWYDYFIEERLIPDQFKFIFREFMEHGCYPFSINQLFNEEATPRLESTGEPIATNTNEWGILNQIAECQWSRRLIQVKSSRQLNIVWDDVVKRQPLKRIPPENRCHIIDVIEICCQLCSMREILAGKPPKIVITGQSQTGKSTLFEYLTG
ncbi:unnamed protein product [Rotaria sp. Silwood2]|nr:unnamed protein product [Rotaria sp. Silwood2]CAF4345040.1 unnamed protein product [Rotaria sp. Silwood2]